MVTGPAAVLQEWRDTAGAYALVPPVLTAFLLVFRAVDPSALPLNLAVNTLITFSIGLLVAPTYHLVLVPALGLLGVPVTEPWLWVCRISSVAIGLGLGADLSARALVAVGVSGEVSPVREQIARVGLVVSSLMIGFLYVRAAAARRELRIRAEAERARLQAVQARTDPHFLYNALNTVAALIPVDPTRAEDAVLRLSDLFRYVLDGARLERVLLRDELRAIDDYLAIEHLRLGDRLRVVREIDPATVELSVPPLLLQPLVENAVQHGIASRRAGGTLTIRAARSGPVLELIVEDDGSGVGVSGGAGTAQVDLRRRLFLVYGPRATLETGPRAEGGYRARIGLPWETT